MVSGLSLLVAPEVVKTTTSCAVGGNEVAIVTALGRLQQTKDMYSIRPRANILSDDNIGFGIANALRGCCSPFID